jgi:hypothetical protein
MRIKIEALYKFVYCHRSSRICSGLSSVLRSGSESGSSQDEMFYCSEPEPENPFEGKIPFFIFSFFKVDG